jgi:uncharacterized membrane protein YphA (DoxX/SURF4 family)
MLSLLYKIVRFSLGTLFLYSGVTKLATPLSFATLIDAYGLIPESFTLPLAILLAVLEIVSGVGLLFDIKGSLTTVSGLLILFMIVIGYGIWMGLDVDCGCFGPEDPEAAAFHGLRSALYRDFCLIVGVIFLYIYRFQHAVTPISFQLLLNNLFKGDSTNEIA